MITAKDYIDRWPSTDWPASKWAPCDFERIKAIQTDAMRCCLTMAARKARQIGVTMECAPLYQLIREMEQAINEVDLQVRVKSESGKGEA